MMFCLRTFLPLLLLPLPLSLSPIHLTTLLAITYILNKPCPYCSLLLVILFASTCHWSGRCFWQSPMDFSSMVDTSGGNATIPWQWEYLPYFIPRLYTTPIEAAAPGNATEGMGEFLMNFANGTLSTIADSVMASGSSMFSATTTHAPSLSLPNPSGAGAVGTQWLRTLFGRGEWTLPCVNIKVVI
jgi:hypothetical protein